MKSDKALATELQIDTFCRHGFHEWVEVSQEGREAHKDQDGKVLQCKHCSKFKHGALKK